MLEKRLIGIMDGFEQGKGDLDGKVGFTTRNAPDGFTELVERGVFKQKTVDAFFHCFLD